MADIVLSITPNVTLDATRCWDCGRWWALERGTHGRCPCCAERRVDKGLAGLAAAERVNRALRGALTKAKGASRG